MSGESSTVPVLSDGTRVCTLPQPGIQAAPRSCTSITFAPQTLYTCYGHDGWQGYGHWLSMRNGNLLGGKKHEFLPFKEALLYVHTLP